MHHLPYFVGSRDLKLSSWVKLPLHLLYHILIMHLSILAQAMEIHRCEIAFTLCIIKCIF